MKKEISHQHNDLENDNFKPMKSSLYSSQPKRLRGHTARQTMSTALILLISCINAISANADVLPSPPTNHKAPPSIDSYQNYQSNHSSQLSKFRRRVSHHTLQRQGEKERLKHNQHLSKLLSSSSGRCRTRFMWRLPSGDELYDLMFASSAKIGKASRGRGAMNGSPLPLEFNHDSIGITHPPSDEDLSLFLSGSHWHEEENVINVSIEGEKPKRECMLPWWPLTSLSSQSMKDGTDEKWRVKRYRRRVGIGKECYEAVRDAALDWEFQNGENEGSCVLSNRQKVQDEDHQADASKMGIIRCMPSIPGGSQRGKYGGSDGNDELHNQNFYTHGHPLFDENTNPNVMQIWNGIHPLGISSKKLATFTKFTFQPPAVLRNLCQSLIAKGRDTSDATNGKLLNFKWPSLYAINPVAVVYDMVDEAVPSTGDIYTCTAYGTLKGHLLTGEERVSVIWRNDEVDADSNAQVNGMLNDRANGSKRSRIGSSPQDQLLLGNEMKSKNRGTRVAINDGFVDVEILSYSRAAPSIWGKMVWPFIAKKQDEFFKGELDALERVAVGTNSKS